MVAMVRGWRWSSGLLGLGCSIDVADGDLFEPPPLGVAGTTESDEASDPADTELAADTGDTTGLEALPTGGDGETTGMLDEGATTGGFDGATSSSGGGDLPSACSPTNDCATATAIGGVSGDEGSTSIDTRGSEPTWVSFQVSEDDASVFGSELSFTVTLQSPPEADFDLYVFRGPEGGSSGCDGTTQQSTNAGRDDSVSMSWGEGGVANNSDDGAWVSVEIRARDEVCAPPAEWTLVVSGNT